MARPFKELRKLMYAEGIDQKYLARCLGRGATYVSMRMRGVAPWDMFDVYRLCELFELPAEQISFYFPKSDICCSTSNKTATAQAQKGR